MGTPGRDPADGELSLLRQALEAETELRVELQRQLEAANAEFEEFVSLAAHNLSEPLRDVASFSQMIAENLAGRLDSDTTEYLDRIRQGAASMQSVLSAVVDYWTIGGDFQASPTDMEAVLAQALLRADKHLTERSATVTHDPLPAVTGDFEILTRVLQHLIENAIAYGNSSSPQVHVSCKQVELNWEFSVHDDGLGIAPKYHTRIFRVFKRLHGREYPGTGLGLAFCKKAIEAQGGRIWLESTIGLGSTFYFTVAPV